MVEILKVKILKVFFCELANCKAVCRWIPIAIYVKQINCKTGAFQPHCFVLSDYIFTLHSLSHVGIKIDGFGECTFRSQCLEVHL